MTLHVQHLYLNCIVPHSQFLVKSNFWESAFTKWNSSVLWNAMIHPLLNMTITGAIWYQGNSF